MKKTKIIYNGNEPKIEYIRWYSILDKIVELVDIMPEHAPSLIQSYEKILELIVKIKEVENVENN